jgi:hypothetical protein
LIRARPDGLKEAQQWISQYAAGWDFSFDALDRLLRNTQGKEEDL